MRFLIDAQLPPALATLLRARGQEARHCYDFLAPDAKDREIWRAALHGEHVLITKDEDFAEWSRLRVPAPSVVWLRVGNLRKSALQARFETLLPDLLSRLETGETLIEVF